MGWSGLAGGRAVNGTWTARVSRVFVDAAPVILWVTLSTGEGFGVTPGHEVWSPGQGWVAIETLSTGDTLANEAGEAVRIVAMHLDEQPTEVYNLEVEGAWTCFVHGVWVHNSGCGLRVPKGWHRHQLFPREFRSYFEGLGMNIDDVVNLLPLDPDWHIWLHRPAHRGGFNWNASWARFIAKEPSRRLRTPLRCEAARTNTCSS